ncbi:unnamed protein product, partial [Brassica rapa subsp. trilocularis]
YRSLSFTSLRFWVSLASSLTIYHTHTHTRYRSHLFLSSFTVSHLSRFSVNNKSTKNPRSDFSLQQINSVAEAADN